MDRLKQETLLIVKKLLKMKIEKKVVNIVERITNFNKELKGKLLKIVNAKQMLQIFPIALAQAKAGNTSENLRNEIRQIIYYLYREKESAQRYNKFNKIIKQNGYHIHEF